jgi:hypothetical protein
MLHIKSADNENSSSACQQQWSIHAYNGAWPVAFNTTEHAVCAYNIAGTTLLRRNRSRRILDLK